MLTSRIDCQIPRSVGLAANILLVLILAVLTACQGTMEPLPLEPVAETEPVPDEVLPPSKRVHKAIQALQSGDKVSARNQLNWALQEKPTLKVAKKLLEQLDADPVEFLGEDHFTYRVQPGESLSIIARDYLGDPLKFVILARYNGIDNPSQLKAEQQLKIPGKTRRAISEREEQSAEVLTESPNSTTVNVLPSEPDLPKAVEATKAPAEEGIAPAIAAVEALPTTAQQKPIATPEQKQAVTAKGPEEIMHSARQLYASGNLTGAIALLEKIGNLSSQPKTLRDQLIGYYRELADSQAKKGGLSKARTALEKAVILDSSNESVIYELIAVEDRIEAQRLYQQGTELLKAQKLPQAYATLSQALTYEPDNSAIASARNQARNKLTDSYHRQAMQLFRKHELNNAIDYWDKILEIDPQHSLAPGYRARAVELKEKLQKINQ